MTTENGKHIKKWTSTEDYRDNYDAIFGKKDPPAVVPSPDKKCPNCKSGNSVRAIGVTTPQILRCDDCAINWEDE